jgi:hypothetical protein
MLGARGDVVGDFRHRPAKFRRSLGLAVSDPQNPEDFWRSATLTAGPALAFSCGEHHVFRAALFSIVLSLAVGQNAGLLCKVWCPDATSAPCPHQDSTASPRVRADDNCDDVVAGTVAFVREDARRTAAASDAQNALVVPRFRLAPSPTDLRPGFESGRRRLLEERPLVIALRI